MATVDGLLHVPIPGMLAAAVGPQPAAAGEPELQDGTWEPCRRPTPMASHRKHRGRAHTCAETQPACQRRPYLT